MPLDDNVSDLKVITKNEVTKHETKKDLWVILHNKVYHHRIDWGIIAHIMRGLQCYAIP